MATMSSLENFSMSSGVDGANGHVPVAAPVRAPVELDLDGHAPGRLSPMSPSQVDAAPSVFIAAGESLTLGSLEQPTTVDFDTVTIEPGGQLVFVGQVSLTRARGHRHALVEAPRAAWGPARWRRCAWLSCGRRGPR